MAALMMLLALILIVVGVFCILTHKGTLLGAVLIIVGCVVFLLRHQLDESSQTDPATVGKTQPYHSGCGVIKDSVQKVVCH